MYPRFHDTIYRPLGAGQTRLLHLLPGLLSAPILCRIEEVYLEDALPYAALSYVWGSPESVNTAIVNDKEMNITTNLHSALLHVRQETSIVTLWVDALCICQDDKLEKSQQVQMIGDIFRTAASTFIWLGESSINDQVVIDYLCRQQSPGASEFQLRDVPIRALRSFFERPWFRRLWILQEALLSKQPVVHYGRHSVPFSSVLRLCSDLIIDNLGNHRGKVFSNCPLKRCMLEWDLLQESVNQRGGWPLVDALSMTERMESTLAEDRVYALLGLATIADRQSIKPEYSKPFESLQPEISARLISSRDAPFEALHYMGISIASEVPSWGRNWAVTALHSWSLIDPFRYKGIGNRSIFPETSATGSWYEMLNLEASKKQWVLKKPSEIGNQFVRFSDDLRICAVRGVAIDHVSCVYVAPTDVMELMRECERWKEAAVRSATAWPTPESRLEAFSKALCRGNYLDSEGRDLTECFAAYKEWVEKRDPLDPSSTLMPPASPIKNDFGHRVEKLTLGRSFFTTNNGFVGLGPAAAKSGDTICYFQGARDPFILRSLPTSSTEAVSAAFVGDTAVVGLMDGEGLNETEAKNIVEYWVQ